METFASDTARYILATVAGGLWPLVKTIIMVTALVWPVVIIFYVARLLKGGL